MQAEDIRYIENPFKKIVNIIKPDQDKLYSMLFNLIQELLEGSHLPTLEAIASDPAKSEVDFTAYTGVNGYLYALIRLAKFFDSETVKSQETQEVMRSSIIADDSVSGALKSSKFYLKLAQEQYNLIAQYLLKTKPKRSSLAFYMSETCTWLCGMHLGYIQRNHDLFRQNQRRLVECFEFYKKFQDKMMSELLYGTPGFLYVFLELQSAYDNVGEELFRTNFAPISKIITEDIIKRGILNFQETQKTKVDLTKELPQNFRLVYLFHKKQYLGAAHGVGGNINILLLSFKMNNFGENINLYCKLISSSIKFMLKHLINGNFATSANSQRIKLVHFCHGSPGIVSGLARFALMFPEQGLKLGLQQVIKVNLEHIWNYGILKKGFGLCHGISGNAYSFIYPSIQQLLPDMRNQLYRKAVLFALLREEKQVMKEIREYNFSDRYKKGVSDFPYSLMLGVAGDICFTMDTIEGVGKFPGFDF